MEGLISQLTSQVLVPIFGTFLVVFAAFLVLLAPVRNRFVRQLGGHAAMFTWLGWMAHIYKVV